MVNLINSQNTAHKMNALSKNHPFLRHVHVEVEQVVGALSGLLGRVVLVEFVDESGAIEQIEH